MKIRRRNIIGLLLSLMLLLCGCGEEQGTTGAIDHKTPVNDGGTIVVGVSQVGSESVWRSANSKSVQEVFTKENGYYLIFDNARQKQENQVKAIRNFISLQVDYIVFSPITEDGWETVLKEAKDAGIPVILMDRKLENKYDGLYTTWVGSDFYGEGVKAGRWLEDYLGDKTEQVNMVVLKGTKGASSMIGRTKGFQDVAKEHSNWKILEEADADYTTAKGEEEMERLLKTYPDIDVLVSQNDDMTFGALKAISAAGKSTGVGGEITVISFDAVKRALELVEKGVINLDVECNPNQGEKLAEVITRLEKKQNIEKAYYVDEMIFTPEKVGLYIKDRTY